MNKKKAVIMIYIGFSTQTHKIYARVFCKKFKHCAPVIIKNKKCYLYQFINKNNIVKIQLKPRDLLILKKHSWFFIQYNGKINIKDAIKTKPSTCVQFTKSACLIKNKHIITPDELLKFLTQK